MRWDTLRLADDEPSPALAGNVALLPRGAVTPWWQAWLRREHPDLFRHYQALYGERSNAPKAYQHEITEKVRALADRYGVGRTNVLRRRTGHERARAASVETPPRSTRPSPTQLSLL